LQVQLCLGDVQNGLWNLDAPTAAQSAFVSVVMGVMTGVFGIWMGHEHKGENNVNSVDRTNSKSR
jgi:hypothetical protein